MWNIGINLETIINIITNSYTFSIKIENVKKGRELWGQTRLWGSVGVSIFGLSSGVLMDINKLNTSVSYCTYLQLIQSWIM